MYTSPRTSTEWPKPPSATRARPAFPSVVGMSFIVSAFCVTSSPVVPSPRVAARTRRPSRYVSAMPRPSILSSQV